MSQNPDYKAMAEQLREQRIRGACKQVAVRDKSAAPQKREVSDKAANLIATALKDFLH
jgi:hypothetical protein